MTNKFLRQFLLIIILIINNSIIFSENSKNETALITASSDGYFNEVKRLVSEGTNINVRDYIRMTPLNNAVSRSYNEIAEFLIKNGADVNAEGGFHFGSRAKLTPLYFAAEKGNLYLTKLLIEHGAKIEFKNCFDETPLFRAVRNDNIEVIKYLLTKGANVNSKSEGDSLLHISLGNKKITEILILYGADINAKNKNGQTPLEFLMPRKFYKSARLDEVLEIVDLLKTVKNKIDSKDKKFEQIREFYVAVTSGKLEAVKKLIKKGLNANSVLFERGDSPLHWAAEWGQVEVAKYLIENGAEINKKNGELWPPLHIAIQTNHMDMVKLLLNNKADVNMPGGWNFYNINNEIILDNKTPLRLAINNNDVELTKLLTENGADIYAKDSNGSLIIENIETKFRNYSSYKDKEPENYKKVKEIFEHFQSIKQKKV